MRYRTCCSLSLLLLMGCAEGTETSAKSFFDGEFKKWVVGQPNAISSTASGTPVGYSFQSVAPDEPNFMVHEPSQEIPANWKSFPAYRLNVSLKCKSGLDGTKETLAIYTATWNTVEKKWYLNKRYLP